MTTRTKTIVGHKWPWKEPDDSMQDGLASLSELHNNSQITTTWCFSHYKNRFCISEEYLGENYECTEQSQVKTSKKK